MAATSPMNKIERAHQMYREGNYDDALGFYTSALSTAKTKPQKIALHSNRAACYLKLHDFKKAAQECTWVLELDQDHTGALMLRAQTLVTLKDYQSALFDVNRLMELNPVSEVYQNLQSRLKSQLSLAPIPEAEDELEEEEDGDSSEAESEEELKEDYNEENDAAAELGVEDAERCSKENRKMDDEQPPNVHKDKTNSVILNADKSLDPKPLARQTTISKPKGHSRLDYSKWDTVEDDSSEDEEDEDECHPQFRFRVKNVGVRAVK